jgi:hypothetical protein
MTIEQRIAAIREEAKTIAILAEIDLAREVLYLSRARVMVATINGVFAAMNGIECEGAQSDFDDDWRALRLTLARAQTQFESVTDGSGDTNRPPCQTNSRYWK